MKNQKVEKQGYDELFQGVVNQIQQSRIKAAIESNWIIGEMYFNIGRIITKIQRQKDNCLLLRNWPKKEKKFLLTKKKQQE